MTAHRHQATWRSLIFNRRYLDNGTANPDNPANLVAAYLNSDYYLDQLDTSRVSVQDYRELRQFLEGGEPNEAYEGVRAINGVGRIVAANPADLEDKAWAMNEAFSVAACRIAAQALDPVGLLPFSFKRDTLPLTAGIPATKALRFYARPGPGRPVVIGRVREGLVRPFSFQLIAFDPFAYDESQTSTGVTVPGGSNVTNPGNIYTRPLIEISASAAGATNFTITNSTTGKSLVINMTDVTGSNPVRTLDTVKGTMKKQDGSNIYSSRVSGFVTDLWLAPGVNAISFANATNITAVTFKFRGAYA